ncbi:MAG: hypothetical protein OT477_14805 [Chloroflexi bacterium]|nr:hypothetical protein [Chloroflexota bacterium]
MKTKTMGLFFLLLLAVACLPQWGSETAAQSVANSVVQAHTFQVLDGGDSAVGTLFNDAGGGVVFRSTSIVGGNHAAVVLEALPDNNPVSLTVLGGGFGGVEVTKAGQSILSVNHSRFCAIACGIKWDEAEGASYKNIAGAVVVNGHALADDDWQAATLASGWGNYGNAYSTAGYRRAPDGVVWLKGTVAPTSKFMSSYIFVLPATYRPAEVMSFPLDGGRVEVRPNGEVSVIGASWVSLDNVRFWPQGD